MTPSEWSQVVELFHAALEKSGDQRVVLLDQVCGTQTTLRNAVEELLKQHESAGSFLSEPLFEIQPRVSRPDVVAQNQLFERFILMQMLGRGGMGEVWSAHDTELDRSVALKFLRAETTPELDTTHIAREAKAASALDHPNIVTIHEVVRSKRCSAIVMELVQGSSLAKLRGASLPIHEVRSIGAQIAKALAAAHANSIVHGDIKPENIMLRDDGYVKVLDFGLARRVALETIAAPGSPVFGTLRYTSPEQARGESLTPASDIFSFGLVLFELATGRRAFPEESPLDALRAILAQDPPAPRSVNPGVPAALDSLILAMLARNPKARPSAKDVAAELTESLAPSKPQILSTTLETRKPQGRRHGWAGVLVSSLIVICLAWAIGWVLFGRRDSPQFADLKIQPLTSQAGWEETPAFSPDGESIAFTWAERLDTAPQIYVKRLNESAPIKLTDSHSAGIVGPLVWSPDGKWIAFKREYTESSGAIFAIPSSGGNEKKILDLRSPDLTSHIDWSPDGMKLAYSEFAPHSEFAPQSELWAIYLFNLRTGEKRKLTAPPPEDTGDWDPKFSPDGRTIAFKRVSGFWMDDIYTVPVAGGEPRRLTRERRGIWGHAWAPDGKSLILSWQRGTTVFGLWQVPLASPSRPERIVQGGVDAITPATCRKARRLAWVNQMQDVNIYRISAAGGQPPVMLIASTVRDQDPVYSPTGQIAFVSDRSGSREIWLARADGTSQTRITNFNGPDVGDLQWSPDGRRLAFYSGAQGHSDIFTLDCVPANMLCGNPKRVISGMKAEVPSWSADGGFLYFASDRTGRFEVWKQATSGGPPIQVTQNGGYATRESSDGKWLYFWKDTNSIWRMPTQSAGHATTGEELVIGPSNNVQRKGWTIIPDEIIFSESAGKTEPGALRAYQILSKRTRLILPLMEGFVDARDYSVSVSPDSKWILYPQIDRSGSNVIVAEYR
ncbi:MAG TPA: protein kinase [Terriglobales bacterium]